MKKIEILSPCGSFEAVVAAVRSGADAVYLGMHEFSARAGAQNFDFETLEKAVSYCHVRGVFVYLTLNTVVFDSELEKAKEIIIFAAKADVDALIVQNVSVAMLARKIVPDMSLHASTQMSVHSLCGAKLLQEMGFKRVVLSREMTREEIKQITDNCSIETEVFAHGALCMSVSGQCYFSSVLGSRSGNRGRCAQPCRLPYTIDGKKGYALSLKDNSIIDQLKDLESINVTSAKIEGRLKRPEYVAASTAACLQARDNGFVSEQTREMLKSVFSRTGFTDGYYTDNRGFNMFGSRKKKDVLSATNKLLSQIRANYKDEKPRIDVSGSFTAEIGKNPVLTVTDGKNTVIKKGEYICEKAVKNSLDCDKCIAQLSKTGGTAYKFGRLDINLEDDVTMPFSEINRLRRDVLSQLDKKRSKINNYTINDYKIPEIAPHTAEIKKTYARFTDTKIGRGFKDCDLCFVPLFSKKDDIKKLISDGFKLGVEIPRGMFSREEKVIQRLRELKELKVEDVLCNNFAAVYIAKSEKMKIHGGFGLNFVNTLDLQWAESYGFEDTELSFEMTFSQIEKLGAKLSRGIISYGYLPLMLTRNCPAKSIDKSCNSCKNQSKMKDRMDKSFIFCCDGCTVEILNSVVLNVRESAKNLKGIDFQTYRFSVENSVEKVENTADFFSNTLNFQKKTNGLYYRGII